MRLSRRNQQSIARSATVAGFGYWSGQDVTLEFRPAEPNTGIRFVRRDLPGCPRISADIRHRVEVPRRTSLEELGARVDMVEHVLAALAGAHVDNCEVWTSAAEMPGCDGSSLPFLEAIDRAGLTPQGAPQPVQMIGEPLRLGSDDSWVEARPAVSGRCVLEYRLDYGSEGPIGKQSLAVELTPEVFRRELAGCRTFMLKKEADWLLGQGLGLRATCRDLLVFDDSGPIDNALRFSDECVRHKLLDMVGDLALAGCDLEGHFTAYRSGHRLSAELVRTLTGRQLPEARRRCA